MAEPGAPQPVAPARFGVATYNVRRCIGSDGRASPQRVAEVIRSLDCALIGLQEVESGPSGQLDALARLTGLHAVAGAALRRGDVDYGNALLSAYPVGRIERINLSVPGREPRAALSVEVCLGEAPLRVVVTHLGLSARERLRQVARLLALCAPPAPEPLVLMGDFNEWRPYAATLRALRQHFGAAGARAPNTFPARRPLLALDRIWVWPAERAALPEAIAGPLARQASDHLPLRRWLAADAGLPKT